MVQKIGIDAGGTLIKVAYEEKGKLHTKSYSNEETDKMMDWLTVVSPGAELYITGGKAVQLKKMTSHRCHLMDEFQAVVSGTRYLIQQEKASPLNEFILINLGTGTSIFHVTADSYERVLGSGIGGGTLMGLGYLITGKKDFHTFTTLASNGDSKKSDLLVRDIYYPDEPPINGDLTAANLGKVHLNPQATESDHLASVMQLIGETIMLLAGQVSMATQISTIVFVGGTVTNNPALKDVFMQFRDMLAYEPIFLEKGSHAGAIGALIG